MRPIIRHLTLLAFAVVACCQVQAADSPELKPEQLYKQATASIITLSVERKDGSKVTGSGFLAQKEGLAVTAWHVVRNAKKVSAKFENGEEFEVSGLVDRDEKRDVALVRVKVFGRTLIATEANDPAVGSKAYVIGAPKGLEFSISDGLISQVRTIDGVKVFQYSCPSSPGNSGGPLINSQGRVVGVVSFQFRDGQNLNFAIPISYALGLDSSLPTQQWDAVPADMGTTTGTFSVKKGEDGTAPKIKIPAVKRRTIEATVSKKEPYTLRLVDYHQKEYASLTIALGSKNLERVAPTAELMKNQYHVNELGVMTFHESLRNKKVKISYDYQPYRIAVMVTRDPSPSDLRDLVKERFEWWGDEVLTGAQVDAVVEKIRQEGGTFHDIAKALDCTYLVTGHTATAVDDDDGVYYLKTTADMEGFDLLSGKQVLKGSYYSNGSIGALRGWRGFRHDLVKDCAFPQVDKMVTR